MMASSLTKSEEQALHYVHTPAESNRAYQNLGEKLYGTTGVDTGSRALDGAMIPTRGPWVRTWVALPGHGKSTMLRAIARRGAQKILDAGLQNTYVAFVTYEESVEVQELGIQRRSFTNEQFWRGEVDPKVVLHDSINRPALPLYFFGESMSRSDLDSLPMTLDVVLDGMRALWKLQGMKPALIVIDYVQEVEVDTDGTRTAQVIAAMRRVMRLGVQTGCATELAAQASYEVYKNEGLPLARAGQIDYSRYPYQKSTNVVSLCRPYNWKRDEEWVKVNGCSLENHPHLTVARPTKHRPGAPAGDIPFLLNPDTLDIADWGGEPESENKEPKQLVF